VAPVRSFFLEPETCAVGNGDVNQSARAQPFGCECDRLICVREVLKAVLEHDVRERFRWNVSDPATDVESERSPMSGSGVVALDSERFRPPGTHVQEQITMATADVQHSRAGTNVGEPDVELITRGEPQEWSGERWPSSRVGVPHGVPQPLTPPA